MGTGGTNGRFCKHKCNTSAQTCLVMMAARKAHFQCWRISCALVTSWGREPWSSRRTLKGSSLRTQGLNRSPPSRSPQVDPKSILIQLTPFQSPQNGPQGSGPGKRVSAQGCAVLSRSWAARIPSHLLPARLSCRALAASSAPAAGCLPRAPRDSVQTPVTSVIVCV